MMLSEAIDAVTRMIGAYPNGGSQAGKSYIGTMAALLCGYPRSVATECADPLRGVTRDTKFLPTVADVVAWCEPRIEALKTGDEWDYRAKAQLDDRERWENQNGPSPGFLERMRDDLAVRGMYVLGAKPKQHEFTPGKAMAKFGLSQEQWDALPDLPPGHWQQAAK